MEPLPDGTPHPTHPHVVWGGDGDSFHPASGYLWISDPPGRADYGMKRLANENDALSHQIEGAEWKLAEIKANPAYAQTAAFLREAYNQQNAIASPKTVRAYGAFSAGSPARCSAMTPPG